MHLEKGTDARGHRALYFVIDVHTQHYLSQGGRHQVRASRIKNADDRFLKRDNLRDLLLCGGELRFEVAAAQLAGRSGSGIDGELYRMTSPSTRR